MDAESRRKWDDGRGAKAPKASNRGTWSMVTRIRIVRDGVGECLTALPRSLSAIEAKLQEAWCMLDAVDATLDKEVEAPWPLPLP